MYFFFFFEKSQIFEWSKLQKFVKIRHLNIFTCGFRQKFINPPNFHIINDFSQYLSSLSVKVQKTSFLTTFSRFVNDPDFFSVFPLSSSNFMPKIRKIVGAVFQKKTQLPTRLTNNTSPELTSWRWELTTNGSDSMGPERYAQVQNFKSVRPLRGMISMGVGGTSIIHAFFFIRKWFIRKLY